MLNAILPAVGTEKRVTWTVKTLMRRGVALRLLCRLEDAIQDFSQVCLFCINPLYYIIFYSIFLGLCTRSIKRIA